MYAYIETKRLIIRPINVADAAFIYDLANAEGWLKFIGDRNISDVQESKNYIRKVLNNPDFYYNVFELREPKKAIGIVTFLKREGENFPDIGFALLPEFEKQGYAVEASKAYLEKIDDLNQYENIIAITNSNNQRSINLLHKLGLQHKGDHKRDEEILSYYSLKK